MLTESFGRATTENHSGRDKQVSAVKDCRFTQTAFGTVVHDSSGPFRVAGSYAWPASKTLELKVHYVNWVSALDLVFHFDGKNVALTVQENYSSGTGMVIKGKVCD